MSSPFARSLAGLVFVGVFVAGVASARAQGCPEEDRCLDACESRQPLCVPPAVLVPDPGPEPPRETASTFSAADAGRTSNDQFGWQPSRATAMDLATSNATSAAGQRCTDGGGSLKKVFLVVEVSPCQARKEMGSEVWNCHVKAQVECEKRQPNPAHASWQAAAKDAEARRVAAANAQGAHERCEKSRFDRIVGCEDSCRRRKLCGAAGGANVGGTGTGTRPGGSNAGTGGRDGPRPTKIQGTVEVGLPAWRQQQLDELKATQARVHQNATELAAMTANMPAKHALLGIGLGLSAPWVFRGLLVGLESIGPMVLPTAVTVMGLLPSVFYLRNPQRLASMKQNYTGAITAAKTRCDEGDLESCHEALELVDAVHDAGRSGGQRRRDRLTLGPRWEGPTFGVRYTASFFAESASQGMLAGDHVGGSTRSMVRVGLGVFGMDVSFRNVSLDGVDRDGQSAAGLVGLQLGAGLTSPYALVAVRGHLLDAPDGSAQYDLAGDVTLELGNTFDLTPIFSTAGPYVVAPTIDVALTLPTSGDVEPGFRIGLGLNTARFWPEKVEDYDLSTSVRPARPRSYLDVAMPYLMPGGGGIQIARFHGKMGKTGSTRQVIVGVDAWVTSKDDGFSAGGALGSWGMRGTASKRRIEYGFATSIAGAEVHSIGTSTIIGALSTKVFLRYADLPVNLEVGAMMPLVWANLGDDDESFAMYDSFPLQGYLGVGFPTGTPDNM